MANDIDFYSQGDLAPYSPGGLQPLAPAPSPDWQQGNDLLPAQHSPTGGSGQRLFGQYPLPPGFTVEQVKAAYQQLGNIFVADFTKLGHGIRHPQMAVKWYLDAMLHPPARQAPRHGYQTWEYVSDPLFQAFSNFAHDNGFSQKLVSDMAWWITTMSKKLAGLNKSSQDGTPAQGRATVQSKDPVDSLSNAQYDQLMAHNERVKAQTINRLAAKYGDHGYKQVIALAQAQLERLPVADQKHFDTWTGDFPWTHMLSTFEAIDGLYAMAIGAGSINKSGIAQEIAAYEAMLKIPSERAKYMKDPQMQARFLELLRIQQGG